MLAECILRNVGKIVAISLGYGIIAVQIVHFVILCLYALTIVLYIRSRYNWLNLKVEANYQAISQKSSVLIQAVAWIVFNHTDIMVLTVVTRDLKLVSVYSVYALVFEAVQNVNNTVRNSYQHKIGYYSQSSKKDLSVYFRNYSTIIYAFTYACFAATYFLTTPFIRLYTLGVADTNYLIRFLPELFVIYKILYCIRATNRQLIEAGGHFKATQGIALREYRRLLAGGPGASELGALALFNVLLFVPFGFFLAAERALRRGNDGGVVRMAAVCGFACSLLLETLQFVLRRGTCELDDLLHNTIGAVLGALLWKAAQALYLNIKRSSARDRRTEIFHPNPLRPPQRSENLSAPRAGLGRAAPLCKDPSGQRDLISPVLRMAAGGA